MITYDVSCMMCFWPKADLTMVLCMCWRVFESRVWSVGRLGFFATAPDMWTSTSVTILPEADNGIFADSARLRAHVAACLRLHHHGGHITVKPPRTDGTVVCFANCARHQDCRFSSRHTYSSNGEGRVVHEMDTTGEHAAVDRVVRGLTWEQRANAASHAAAPPSRALREMVSDCISPLQMPPVAALRSQRRAYLGRDIHKQTRTTSYASWRSWLGQRIAETADESQLSLFDFSVLADVRGPPGCAGIVVCRAFVKRVTALWTASESSHDEYEGYMVWDGAYKVNIAGWVLEGVALVAKHLGRGNLWRSTGLLACYAFVPKDLPLRIIRFGFPLHAALLLCV